MKRYLSGDTSRVSIPITPMLDMTFQLLFFFVLNFRVIAPEGMIDLALPKDAGVKGGPDNKAAVDPEPPPPADLTIKVRTILDNVNDGEISAILIVYTFGKARPVDGLDGLKQELGILRPKLAMKDSPKITLQGDGKLKVRNLMKVMDACRQAGFKNVSMVPPEDFR